jgi:hypothetical protein
MESESRVALTTLVAYASPKGTVEQATFVVLRAPTSDAFAPAAKIRQAVTRAFTTLARENQIARAKLLAAGGTIPEAEDAEGETAKMTGEEMISALAASDSDLGEVLSMVKQLLVEHGVGLLDGEVKFTPITFARLTFADFQKIAGEYLATFTLA